MIVLLLSDSRRGDEEGAPMETRPLRLMFVPVVEVDFRGMGEEVEGEFDCC